MNQPDHARSSDAPSVFYAEIAESGFDQGRCLALLIAKLGTGMDGPAGADDLFGNGLGFFENFTPVRRNHDRKLRTWTMRALGAIVLFNFYPLGGINPPVRWITLAAH
jgi:hypothetical protein